MTNEKALEVLKSWLRLAYQNANGTDEDSAELYEALQTVFYLITRQQAMVEKSEKVEHFADKTIATLQAENERLKVENQSLRGDANSLKMHYEEAKAEIEELRKGFIANADYFASEYDKNIKSEAVKEFAGLVKSNKRKLFNYIYSSKGFDEQIDNLVKEMVYM